MPESLAEPFIELQEVAFNYIRRAGYFSRNTFWALKNVSFALHKGESLGLIGRNGAGKSTLLRLLAGIVNPDKGKVVNHGCTATLLSLQAGFTPYLSGRKNAMLSGMMLGMDKKAMREKIESIKYFSGLGEFFEYPVHSYSAGMKARLGFSVAFQVDTDIILIDEVLGVGDESFKKMSTKAMRTKILSNQTVVLVSHNQQTLSELCTRIVWIENGTVQMTGEPRPVLDAYLQYIRDVVQK